MKASVKLRPQPLDNPAAPPYLPLLRVKLPVTLLGLPCLSSASFGPAPTDPSLELRTLLPRGPSLLLSFQPPSFLSDLSPSFGLTLSFGFGPLASPLRSPLSLSTHLPLGASSSSPTFSLRVSARLGDLSFKRFVPLSSPPAPANPPKENGGGLYRPLPLGGGGRRGGPPWAGGGDLHWALLDSGVVVRTAMPIAGRAAVKVRWGVRLPSDAGGGGGHVGPPLLTVDKITVERVEGTEVDGEGGRRVVDAGGKGGWCSIREEADGEGGRRLVDVGGKGAWCSIGKEAEELRREQASIRRGIEEIRAGIVTTRKKKP